MGILETFTGGSNKQTIYTKRDVFLVDPSMVRVIFTLWDDLAREFNGNRIQVIAIKNAIVTDYKGKKNIGKRIDQSLHQSTHTREIQNRNMVSSKMEH